MLLLSRAIFKDEKTEPRNLRILVNESSLGLKRDLSYSIYLSVIVFYVAADNTSIDIISRNLKSGVSVCLFFNALIHNNADFYILC